MNNSSKINLPISRSTSKETRNRFDNLLKNALSQKLDSKKTAFSQQTIEDEKKDITINTAEDLSLNVDRPEATQHDEIKILDIYQENVSKENYILEKFLSDATSIKQDDKAETQLPIAITFLKPVPLPRNLKKKPLKTDEISNNSSYRTYSITSPNITNPELLKDIDKLSISTSNTYNVTKPNKKVVNRHQSSDITSNSSVASGQYPPKHYTSPIGDIIIHSNETSRNKTTIDIIEEGFSKEKISKTATKIDVSKLQPNEIQEIIDNKYKEIERKNGVATNSIKEDYLKSTGDNANEDVTTDNSFNQTEDVTLLEDNKHYKYKNFIGVAIYRCDKLTLNNYINHPCVKVHIVDSVTGEYLKRSRTIEEDINDLSTAYVYPLITKAYNMQEKRSLVPNWEELLIFNEDFDYMLNTINPVVIFFEILDFLSYTDASLRYKSEGSFSGWHKIAWAFLKPIGKGYLNTDQKLRLQLYKPRKIIVRKTSKECVLHDWWTCGELIKYPSSIHICIKKVKNTNQETAPNLEDQDEVKKENIRSDYAEDVDAEHATQIMNDNYYDNNDAKLTIKWTRKSSQSCKIPNKVLIEFKSADKGCFVLKFSNDGLLVACAMASLTKYPIYVYAIGKRDLYCKFEGHQGLIYDFNWCPDDRYLISAASDCTVCIWNILSKQYFPVQLLPHPSFVYCVLLKQLEDTEIITGCYDKVLRIWRTDDKTDVGTNYDLKQELEGHIGYITSICSRKHEHIIYSSDSLGVIIEWIFNCEQWNIARELKFKEYHNTIINKIILHPTVDKLIVYCRDSTIRMLDLKFNCIIQWYKGALNDRLLLTGCITPCGSYIFGSSEDGSICIWNTDTGILQATYNPYMKKSKVLTIPYCIEYHPFDNIIIFCHYGSPIPVLLCIYHRSFTGIDLLLKDCTGVTFVKNEKRKKKCKKIFSNGDSIKNNTNVSLGGIIEKIDEVLVSAKV